MPFFDKLQHVMSSSHVLALVVAEQSLNVCMIDLTLLWRPILSLCCGKKKLQINFRHVQFDPKKFPALSKRANEGLEHCQKGRDCPDATAIDALFAIPKCVMVTRYPCPPSLICICRGLKVMFT